MVKVTNLVKRYNDLEILKSISLEIKAKEIVSIVGPSGAGKTTLLQILGTLDKPTSGELLINGTNTLLLNDTELSEFRNKTIGFVFQFHNLLPEFNVLENVCLPAWIGKKKDSEAYAKELLNYLGLSHRMHHKPAELSGGEQQRTAVARALINNPAIVLADEPSGNLDSKNAEELHKLFFDLRDKFNQTFIIVTHNNELAKATDRMITLNDGKIV